MKNEQVSANEAELKSASATSAPGAPQSAKNLDAENLSRDLCQAPTSCNTRSELCASVLSRAA